MIELKRVEKSYSLPRISIEVLRGIDLEVKEGEFVTIMGPSGSGKSTILHIIGCLDRPTSGLYLFSGTDISGKTDNELAEIRNRKIGFVFQGFNLLPRFSAWKNVELPLLYSGVSSHERQEKTYQTLEKLGLSDRAGHTPSELSGGEQQRVAIARALINNPSVILADEPTGNLDSHSGVEIMNIFSRLKEEGVTIIMVTHEKDIASTAERVITLKDGVCYNGCY
ncbi:MAG: ABC transporter ATP-binding protein [Nitrospirae bacterium]|nr:ABC transporter ATP-binding protein [Nitrospirota bacterium]